MATTLSQQQNVQVDRFARAGGPGFQVTWFGNGQPEGWVQVDTEAGAEAIAAVIRADRRIRAEQDQAQRFAELGIGL